MFKGTLVILSRPIPLETGNWCWTVSHTPYTLPDDLGHNRKVTLMYQAPPGPGTFCVVRDEERRYWKVYHWQLTAGSEYELEPGRWFPESHARARAYLRRLLERSTKREVLAMERFAEAMMEDIRETLARYPAWGYLE